MSFLSIVGRIVRAAVRGAARAAREIPEVVKVAPSVVVRRITIRPAVGGAVEEFLAQAESKGLLQELEKIVKEAGEATLTKYGFSTETREFARQVIRVFETAAAGNVTATEWLRMFASELKPEHRQALQKFLTEYIKFTHRRGYKTLAKVATPVGAVLGALYYKYNVEPQVFVNMIDEVKREIGHALAVFSGAPEHEYTDIGGPAGALARAALKYAERKYASLAKAGMPGAWTLIAMEARKRAREYIQDISPVVYKARKIIDEELGKLGCREVDLDLIAKMAEEIQKRGKDFITTATIYQAYLDQISGHSPKWIAEHTSFYVRSWLRTLLVEHALSKLKDAIEALKRKYPELETEAMGVKNLLSSLLYDYTKYSVPGSIEVATRYISAYLILKNAVDYARKLGQNPRESPYVRAAVQWVTQFYKLPSTIVEQMVNHILSKTESTARLTSKLLKTPV